MIKDMFNVGKLHGEIKRLQGEMSVVTKDRDAQLSKLKEFEETHRDYMQSAETANSMKEKHKKEITALNKTIETMKADFAAKLSEKDNDVAQAKEQMSKDIVTESINLVASQGTNIVIDTKSPAVMTPEQAYQHLESLSGKDKQTFYEANRYLLQSILKTR